MLRDKLRVFVSRISPPLLAYDQCMSFKITFTHFKPFILPLKRRGSKANNTAKFEKYAILSPKNIE